MKPERVRHLRLILLIILLGTLTGRVSLSAAQPHSANAAVLSQIYWGASIAGAPYGSSYGDAPGDTTTWDLFEQHAKKKVSILHWPEAWYSNGSWQTFSTQHFDTVRSRGAIPLLSWGSWNDADGPDQSAFALRNIANGASHSYNGQTFDQYVTSWARAAKAWGHPFFLRFDQEMNGWWQFPWATAANPNTGATINNNTPQDYINAWRHVHNIFASVGATNVTWIWCPNISSRNTMPFSQLYPGDSYVDWTCIDGYNNSASNWQTFAEVYGGSSSNGYHDSYSEVTSVAPTKPVMIGEWASTEANDGGVKKAAWITDAFLTQLPINYTKIKAVVWFNDTPPPGKNDSGDKYYIESTTLSQSAFATAIASSYYASNSFGSLTTSPIAPLGSVSSGDISINAGGDGVGSFSADTDDSGGLAYTTTASIDLQGVTNPAPQAVYQSFRSGNFVYTIPNLTPGASYTVRLHFVDTYCTAAGQRLFNVAINGTPVLTNFDIVATAGARNKAVIKEFTAAANSRGTLTIGFTTVTYHAIISGIEVLPAS